MRKLSPIPKDVRDEALGIVERIYGIGETRAKCYYGPATPLSCWNATHYSDGRRSIIVLHGKFRTRAHAGGYYRAEVLAHEFVHAFRVKYGEAIFEEHLAWQTASKAWRRALGGCFRSSPQILALVLLLPVSIPYEIAVRRRFGRIPLRQLVRMSEREAREGVRHGDNSFGRARSPSAPKSAISPSCDCGPPGGRSLPSDDFSTNHKPTTQKKGKKQ